MYVIYSKNPDIFVLLYYIIYNILILLKSIIWKFYRILF